MGYGKVRGGMGVGVWKCVWGVGKCVWDVGRGVERVLKWGQCEGMWGLLGSAGRNVGLSGTAGKCGEKGGDTIWDPNSPDPNLPDHNFPDPQLP